MTGAPSDVWSFGFYWDTQPLLLSPPHESELPFVPRFQWTAVEAAKEYLLKHGYDALNGVRPLRRLIQDTIEDQVAVELLGDKHVTGDIVRVSVKNDALSYSTATE